MELLMDAEHILVTVAFAVALATGCGLDCSGQSIPHCPSGSAAQCVNGAWQCLAIDLAGQSPVDLSSPRDLTSSSSD
jgi:hypothetical protein